MFHQRINKINGSLDRQVHLCLYNPSFCGITLAFGQGSEIIRGISNTRANLTKEKYFIRLSLDKFFYSHILVFLLPYLKKSK